MDFMVVHDYSAGAELEAATYAAKDLRNGRGLAGLKQAAQKAVGRTLPLALTEWNVNKTAPADSRVGAQMQAEAMCRFLQAGVDMATFWPLRLPEAGGRALLDWKSQQPRSPWQVLHLFSANALTNIVQATTGDHGLVVLATAAVDGRKLAVFLINKSPVPTALDVAFDLGEFPAQSAQGEALVGSRPSLEELRTVPFEVVRKGGHWQCKLPAQAVSVVTFEP